MMLRCLAIGLLAVVGCSRDSSTQLPLVIKSSPRASSEHTVLVELFTSEGCSSCPPADRVVRELVDEEDLDVVAVAYHVDYWNSLGWADRFSSDRWSERQSQYAAAFSTSRVYTPQLLVDGRDPRTGPYARPLRQAIEQARTRAGAEQIQLEVVAKRRGRTVDVDLFVDALGAFEADASVFVALVLPEASTQVRRGENAGRSLRHAAVAVELAQACPLEPGRQTCSVKLPALRDRELEVIAFVQSRSSMAVLQSARTSVES